MFIKPVGGAKVRDPVSKRHLPESGKDVQPSVYWTRRLAAGEVVEIEQITDSRLHAADELPQAESADEGLSDDDLV